MGNKGKVPPRAPGWTDGWVRATKIRQRQQAAHQAKLAKPGTPDTHPPSDDSADDGKAIRLPGGADSPIAKTVAATKEHLVQVGHRARPIAELGQALLEALWELEQLCRMAVPAREQMLSKSAQSVSVSHGPTDAERRMLMLCHQVRHFGYTTTADRARHAYAEIRDVLIADRFLPRPEERL
jgi:hypothetical protein